MAGGWLPTGFWETLGASVYRVCVLRGIPGMCAEMHDLFWQQRSRAAGEQEQRSPRAGGEREPGGRRRERSRSRSIVVLAADQQSSAD